MRDWNTLTADENRIMKKHRTKGRGGARVNKVIVHYNYGDLSIPSIWRVWQTRQASAHYQVDRNGRIGQLVWDGDTAWHAGNRAANRTSIGIEHANGDRGNPKGKLTAACIDNGAHLVAAICKRYGLGRPKWMVNVFPHNHFTSTSCPGPLGTTQRDEYMARAQYWYDQMTGSNMPPKPQPKPAAKPYLITVTAKSGLNIRKGPGANFARNGAIPAGPTKYTIVETRNGWGRLKSGAGWISLKYTKRV